MQLRSELRDAAISAAKACGHANVEPRHLHLAIARRFRDRPEVEARAAAARRALEPSGSATARPAVGAETEALLESIAAPEDAVKLLLQAFAASDAPSGGDEPASAQPSVATAQPAVAAPPAAAAGKHGPAEILAELDALIGLGPVKAQVRSVLAVVQANAERKKAGLQPVNPSLHLVFTGPPGTGKTTVARLVARLYAAAGALPGACFTEAARADLVAGYVGQTALKTAEVVRKTRPGVLFLDEAYALTPTSPVDFGSEAIATLVKAMEDHRDDFAVIVAGYSHEMTKFVDSNPGLRSRFKTYIDFPDYSAGELVQIFVKIAREAQIELADGVLDAVACACAAGVRREAFGNARFVRSLFEQAYARMAARAAADGVVSVDELRTITPADVVLDADALRQEERRIGFDA